MDSFNFYQSLYNRELSRREALDRAMNLPITILTIIVGIYSWQLDQLPPDFTMGKIGFNEWSLLITGLVVLCAVLFLIVSYNNFFRGFSYKNLSLPSRIRHFETKEISDYNKNVGENEKMDFKMELIGRIIAITDSYTTINDKRSLSLYRAKTFLIVALLMIGLQLLLISI